MNNDKDVKDKNNRESYPPDFDSLEEINESPIEKEEPVNIISEDSPLNKTTETLVDINVIKEELCKLPLNPCEKEYIENSVAPLSRILEELAGTSFSLSSSVNILTNTPIVDRKTSKLKDTIRLIYKLNDKCEDIYDVLEKRIDILLCDDNKKC